jgi:snurportin-1
MFAEELEELPEDLSSWRILMCPAGKRCLVVASQGKTRAYARNGHLLKTFPSLLPGGSPLSRMDFSILDCIFEEITMTFHALDIMCWRSHPLYSCETDFRFYWLGVRLQEEHANESSLKNPFCFKQVKVLPASPEAVSRIVDGREQVDYPLDGLILYCAQAFYEAGPSPLCLWISKIEIAKSLALTMAHQVI